MYGTAQMQLDTCTQGTFYCNEATSHITMVQVKGNLMLQVEHKHFSL